MDEIVALVDIDGHVIGEAPRSRVRSENLLHTATAVLVRNGERAIYVHQRSATKDWCPSHHDAAAGGVMRAGENPADNARRELGEELGIDVDTLTSLGTSPYSDQSVSVVEHVFEAHWDGPVRFADGEVIAGEWMSLAELGERLADPEWDFVPDTRRLLARFASEGTLDYAGLLENVTVTDILGR